MLSAVALIPSAPVLVPQLAGEAAVEVADLRNAVLAAAAELPPRWIVVGVTDDIVISPDAAGTFAGYGVDVGVKMSPTAGAFRQLPLCALIAGWARGQVAPAARAEVRGYSVRHHVDAAVARGRALRAVIDDAAESVGVLVVADGLTTLTPPAPGGFDADSPPVQAALDDALAAGDTAALTRLPAAVVGRVAYQVLAGLISAPGWAHELYRGAPYGVGYFAGIWRP